MSLRSRTSPLSDPQLPFWPDHVRGVPNGVLRSALYGVAPNTGKHERVSDYALPTALKSMAVTYSGQLLDQYDLTVLEQAIHLARQQPLGAPVIFQPKSFIRAMGVKWGTGPRDALFQSLDRQAEGIVTLDSEKFHFRGALLAWSRNKETQECAISLPLDLLALYSSGWSAQRWEQRLKLGRDSLALWLHAFTTGQKSPLTFDLAELQQYSRSSFARPRDFRAKLAAACKRINDAGVALRLDFDGNGRCTVVPSESRTQPT